MISTLIGIPPTNICRGESIENLKSPPTVPVGLPSELLHNRPDILQAEYQLIAANAEIGVAKAAFFPAISLTSLFGYESTSLRNFLSQGSQNWNWGVAFLEPLFTGWRLTYQLEEAKALACEAIHTYQQTILVAMQEVSDALIGYQKSKEIVEVRTRLVDALADYLKLSVLRYDNGQNDYLTVLNAETSLFQAQLELINSESLVFLSLIDIYKAVGGGWVIDADQNLTTCEAP